MTYRGRVKNGVIVLDQRAELPEGQEVSVRVLRASKGKAARRLPTFYERMKEFAGAVQGPPDLADNHDHYLHGRPRSRAKLRKKSQTLHDLLKPVIGKAKGLPVDAAINHNHHLRGLPKK